MIRRGRHKDEIGRPWRLSILTGLIIRLGGVVVGGGVVIAGGTGGKGWCTRLVHCKYTARIWTKYPPYTDLGTGSTFRIFQANFFAVSLVQEIPGTFTVSPVI